MRLKALVCVVVATAALGTLPSAAKTERVSIGPGLVFSPPDKFVRVGDVVEWTHNDGQTAHSVRSVPESAETFRSSDNCPGDFLNNDCMTQGDTYSHQFKTVGNFEYFCEVHPSQMRATIHVVTAPTTPPTSPSPTPTVTSSKSPTASPGRSPTGSPTASPSPSPTGSPSPSPATPASPTATARASEPTSSGGGGARAAIAIVVVAALGGAGYLVWRRFLAGT